MTMGPRDEAYLSGSYRPEEAAGGMADELARLHSQVELSWSEEVRLLHSLGLTDGMAIVELGAGPGFVTERLLGLLPSSQVCAVDVRADLLAEAERRLGRIEGARLELRQASAAETGLPGDRFDLVIARFLFQHLEDPLAAAKEAYRLLRPGGRLVVIDMDAALWGLAEPFSPALQPILAKAERLQLERGGNRLMGRYLPRLLETAGFERARLEAFIYHSDALGIEAFRAQMSPARLLPALRRSLISRAEYDLVVAEHERFFESPLSFVLMVGLLAHGVHPR
jgi:ubiquinone/menaquinone biosynthesis C-methylase UbiE